ncbi:MAG: mechanosensitive ion channel family protein [Eubacterium sp.]|nr:mechanosensitive ion channel family protein [Eubacterium sp.]
MTYDNIGEVGSNLLNAIDHVNLVEKGVSVLVTVIVFLILRRVCDAVIRRIFDEQKRGSTPQEEKRIITLRKTTATFTHTALLICAALMILSFFIDVGALLAVAGVGTLAIGFGAQGLVEDVMSGFVIIFENQFAVGDYVTIDGTHYGVVEAIGVRTTRLRETDGSLYIIHNGKIDRLINHSKGAVKAQVAVDVAYGEDLDRVIRVLQDTCAAIYEGSPGLFSACPEVAGVTQLKASVVTVTLLADIDVSKKYRAENALRKAVKEAFDREGIAAPYDKYVVYSGDEEGESHG